MMHITDLLNSASYRQAFTAALFRFTGNVETGVIFTAAQAHEILKNIDVTGTDEFAIVGTIFHGIVSEIATENKDHPILAAKINERGLIVYGHKLSYVSYEDVNENNEPIVSHYVGLFGSMLPEGIRLQISTENVGTGDKAYTRPVGVLMRDYKNSKGKVQTASLMVGILDTVKARKIDYREWVAQSLGLDEDELVERGLMGQWAEPKLGSGGGDRVKLTQLGEDAMDYGPRSYEVVSVNYEEKEDTRSGYAQVGFELLLNGVITSTWSEVAFVLEKSRDRGGIGYSPTVSDALACGAKYYLHVLGTKPKMKWDPVAKKDVLYVDKNGKSWETIDAYLSPQPAIHPRLLAQASMPAVQPQPVLAGVGSKLKSAEVAEGLGYLPSRKASLEPDYEDIPF